MMRAELRVAIAVALLLIPACRTESGSGNVVTQQIDAGPFSRIEVSDSFTVNLTIGSPQAVAVRVDDNIVDNLDVGVSGDTLRIDTKSAVDVTDATLEADVTVDSLSALDVSGASTITLTNPLVADALTMTISGASRLNGPTETDDGSLEISGASMVDLSGSATKLDVTESGASQFHAQGLSVEALTIELSGASLAEVTVTGSLSSSASGASALRYAGSPTVERSDASGGSTIEPLE